MVIEISVQGFLYSAIRPVVGQILKVRFMDLARRLLLRLPAGLVCGHNLSQNMHHNVMNHWMNNAVLYLGSGAEESSGSRLRGSRRGSEGEGGLGGGGGGAEASEGGFGGRRLPKRRGLSRRRRPEPAERRLGRGRGAET